MKQFIICCLVVMLGACSLHLNPFANSKAAKEKATKENEALIALQKGQQLYTMNCSKCHALKDPQSRTKPEWTSIIPPMSIKARITPQEEALITNYLLLMARK